MKRSAGILCLLSAGLLWSASGCITINPGALVGKPKKQNIQNASFEEDAIEEAPQTPANMAKLKLTYAHLMEDVGRLTEARENYHFVAQQEPENLEAILGMARLELMTGQYAAAETGFKKALKLAPNSAEANYGLGQYYASQERWNDTIAPMTKAMLSEPNNSQYRYALAVSLTNNGDIDSALPHFIRTVGDAEAHYNVASILKKKGELAEAEKHLMMAITKKPDLEEARVSLQELRNQQASVENTRMKNSVTTQIVPAGNLAKPSIANDLSNSQKQQSLNQRITANHSL